ncbi:MAG: hypothetical protein ACFFEE_07585, partial [Candidatus Thorarchaeota archaeon]
GTLNSDGNSSFMVWILDDERKKISFTIGWHRSFQISSLAAKFGGLPYAVGLWNGRHAKKYYGDQSYKNLKILKKKIDPLNLMNPVKVFGGRVTPGRVSLLAGFVLGFSIALMVSILGPSILGSSFLIQLMSASFIPGFMIPNYIWVSIFGGFLGSLIIKLMTLNQALAIGIPLLRILSKLLRK